MRHLIHNQCHHDDDDNDPDDDDDDDGSVEDERDDDFRLFQITLVTYQVLSWITSHLSANFVVV